MNDSMILSNSPFFDDLSYASDFFAFFVSLISLAFGLGLVPLLAELGDHPTKLSLVSVGSLQKLVLQKLVRRPPLLWVLNERLIDEILENGRPAFLEGRRAFLHDVHDHAVLRL